MVNKTIEVMYLQVTLCPGHVSAGEFNRAHFAANSNGWTYGDLSLETELSYEYLSCENGVYEFVSSDAPNAKPYTIKEW